MLKLVGTATAAAAAALLWTGVLSDPAKAATWRPHRHYHHHHYVWRHYHHHWRWGDNDWAIVRWASGDCKIWHDDGAPPWGDDWRLLADGMGTPHAAWHRLRHLQRHGRCA
jgi:hypothetical protein